MKKLIILSFIMFSSCSLLAEKMDLGHDSALVAGWTGYYALDEDAYDNPFDRYRTCVRIDGSYVSDRVLYLPVTGGYPLVLTSYLYKIAKTLDTNTHYGEYTNAGNSDMIFPAWPEYIIYVTNRFQVLLNEVQTAGDTAFRTMEIQELTEIHAKYTRITNFTTIWGGITVASSYSYVYSHSVTNDPALEMRYPQLVTDDTTYEEVLENSAWCAVVRSDNIHPAQWQAAIDIPVDTDTRPFLDRATDEMESRRYIFTEQAEMRLGSVIAALVGLQAGSIIEIFNNGVISNGTAHMVDGNKVWGWVHTSSKGSLPLYYVPIDDPHGEYGEGGINRFGIFWINAPSDVPVYGGKPIRIPVYVFNGWIFSGIIAIDSSVSYEDYIYLVRDRTWNDLFKNNLMGVAEDVYYTD